MTTREWESTLNIARAAALRGLGMDARPEVMHPNRRRIDVEVHIGSALIAVEAEHGQTPAKQTDAIKDADARLKQGLATCAVAVCYPANSAPETLPAAKFIWTVRDGSPQAAQWTGGDLERLVSVLRLAPAQMGNPDNVAASLSSSLDGAVQRLSAAQKELLAQALDLPRQTRNGRPVRNPWDAPAKRALLVVATAVMFHSRLDVHLRDMRPERDNRHNPPPPYSGPWPPAMAQQCANSDTNIADFRQAWDLILALDYKPIFQTGRAALGACPPEPAVSAAISDLDIRQHLASHYYIETIVTSHDPERIYFPENTKDGKAGCQVYTIALGLSGSGGWQGKTIPCILTKYPADLRKGNYC